MTVGGRELPEDLIEAWELRTSATVARHLDRAFGLDGPRRMLERGSVDLAEVRRSLVDAKLQIEPQRFRDHLDRLLRFSTASAKATSPARAPRETSGTGR
ncbi:MAG: hypothetical protein ACEQSX_00910 [Baekduiaceae bacterium]